MHTFNFFSLSFEYLPEKNVFVFVDDSTIENKGIKKRTEEGTKNNTDSDKTKGEVQTRRDT